jgi:hypothetical protein
MPRVFGLLPRKPANPPVIEVELTSRRGTERRDPNCLETDILTAHNLLRFIQMDTAVNVFVRVRPLIGREILDKVGECITVYNNKQLALDDRHFTFDRIFNPSTPQVSLLSSYI